MNSQKTLKVLLVEDDSDDYRLFMKQLADQEVAVFVDWAEDFSTAASKLTQQAFDIVLTDLSLPDSRGLATVEKLQPLVGNLPIIVLTSLDDECMEQDLLECGAQDYLVKGELNGRATVRAIVHAIQRQHMQTELTSLLKEREDNQLQLRQHATLLKKKNRRLARLYKTGQEFVDNVSHDFRTPLTVIKDYVAIIREGMVGDINEEQKRMLDKVSIRADDLNNMVDDLLDVSKLEAGLLGAWRRNVSVRDIVERVASMLQERARAKNVSFEVDCACDLPEVYCDADMAGRIITNLAVNAIKFCGEDGKVRLWAAADHAKRQVDIGVTDNGPGIDAEAMSKLFKRFSQEDSRVKTTEKGFGLGLSIANQFCRLNLGELKVESRLGEGSTFSFHVPVASPPEVLSRWITSQCCVGDSLQLVEVTLASEVAEASADDFDRFLNSLLRKHDLLFRVGGCMWLLVMAVPQCEADCWVKRVTEDFHKHNRNRPMGPLPEYRVISKGRWELGSQHDEMLAAFNEVLGDSVVSNTACEHYCVVEAEE